MLQRPRSGDCDGFDGAGGRRGSAVQRGVDVDAAIVPPNVQGGVVPRQAHGGGDVWQAHQPAGGGEGGGGRQRDPAPLVNFSPDFRLQICIKL